LTHFFVRRTLAFFSFFFFLPLGFFLATYYRLILTRQVFCFFCRLCGLVSTVIPGTPFFSLDGDDHLFFFFDLFFSSKNTTSVGGQLSRVPSRPSARFGFWFRSFVFYESGFF